MALREKIGPDEAEPEGCGGSTVEGENDVWPDLLHNPKGRANFPISSSLVASRHPVCITPRSLNSQKLSPVDTTPVVLTGPNSFLCIRKSALQAVEDIRPVWRRKPFLSAISAHFAKEETPARDALPCNDSTREI